MPVLRIPPLYRAGGTGDEYCTGVATESLDIAYVTGWTSSPDLTQVKALQSFHPDGYSDAFAVKIVPDDLIPPSLTSRPVIHSDGWPIQAFAFNDVGSVLVAGGNSYGSADGLLLVSTDRFLKFAAAGDPAPGVEAIEFTS